MRKILVYIEPHPVRNYFEEFYDVGLLLCDGMQQLDISSGYDFRYFSNDAVIDRMVTERPNLAYLSLRLTSPENERLEEFYSQWNLKSITEWLSLVKGVGPIPDFYVSVLERLHQEYPFDAILLWSDNGAVRRFGVETKIPVVHAEFGPTRSPFHKTIYFDPQGTNGAAAVLDAPLEDIMPKIVVPSETWVTREGKSWNDENKVGLIDAPLTLDTDLAKDSLPSPYIFIPLQLEDDLNTQLYSEFKTPESFLRHVIPQAISAGFNVVIKGHPAAPGRTFNLISETRALKYASSLGDKVHILPRDTSPFRSINVIAQASAVLTINSSVGFEAILMGKKVCLYGDAAFDVGGTLKAGDTLNNSVLKQPDHEYLDKLTSFLCNHYLHPLESVTKGNAIATVLDYIFASRNHEFSSKEFWNGWIKNIDFGYQWLCESNDIPNEKYRDTGKLAGNRYIFEGGSRKISVLDQRLQINAIHKNERISASCISIENSFIGFIDSIIIEDGPDAKHVEVSGWCLDRQGFRPPVQLYFCNDNDVISIHRVLTVRRDVPEVIGKRVAPRCGFTFSVEKSHISSGNCKLILLSTSNFAQIIPLTVGSIHK